MWTCACSVEYVRILPDSGSSNTKEATGRIRYWTASLRAANRRLGNGNGRRNGEGAREVALAYKGVERMIRRLQSYGLLRCFAGWLILNNTGHDHESSLRLLGYGA